MSTFTATCPMCGEGVQPPVGRSAVATCPSCGEVIPLPSGWGLPRRSAAAESWRVIRRGVGHMAVSSAIVAGGLIGLAGTLTPLFVGVRFAGAVAVYGAAAVILYLSHILWYVNGLETAASGAAVFRRQAHAAGAARLLKLQLISAWCAPIAALFAAIPPAHTAEVALKILSGLLMASAFTYGLANVSACLFLRDVAREIGNRRVPRVAAVYAVAALLLGVTGADALYLLLTPAQSPEPPLIDVRAAAAPYSAIGLLAYHLLFFFLCRRTSRLIGTEIEFELAPQTAHRDATPTHRPAGQSSVPTTLPTHAE